VPPTAPTMKISNKPRVFLALYHRDKFSLPPRRDELGLASFHWALLITPKNAAGETHILDVTDAMQIDPVRHIDTNPDRDWIFRNRFENPIAIVRLVLIAMIGKLSLSVKGIEALIETLKKECRVPKKDTPGEHFVWWVKELIHFLQDNGLLKNFDINSVFLDAHRRAIDRIDSADIATRRTQVANFTSRACDVSFNK
jgi:hypothetical protein